MKIGFANIYSFRPHVEHLYFLSSLMRDAGHEVYFLTCDAGSENCYARALKGSGKLTECPKCILGGIRSYSGANVTAIAPLASDLPVSTLDGLALSSSCTLTRTETDDDWHLPATVEMRESLYGAIDSVYASATRWIKDNQLDAVVCFNGRMDLPRALTFACEQASVPYVTHERTWFGDGLLLIPNGNCLSIAQYLKMNAAFESKPLTLDQARLAGKLVAERFLQKNSLEWRVYNKSPEPAPWPLKAPGARILILPSSRNEFAGHDEWVSGWHDNTQAIDALLESMGVQPNQVVVRCHPNWAENIGKVSGTRSLDVYIEWAQNRGIHCISSEQKASTYDLIQQSDIVVMNGGSAAVEAGVCGKQIICLGPVNYEHAGFVQVIHGPAELSTFDHSKRIAPATVIRKTLRFLYLSARRFPQYNRFVRPRDTARYTYYAGADPSRLITMFQTGQVAPDDASYATDALSEDVVVRALMAKDWAGLAAYEEPTQSLATLDISRRKGLRWLDGVRAWLPLGDRA